MANTNVLLRVLYGSGQLPLLSTATEGSMYVLTSDSTSGGNYNGSLYFDLGGNRYQIQSSVADHVAQSLSLQLGGTQLGESYNGANERTWNIPVAGADTVGLMSTGTQTFKGTKTFQNAITFNSTVTIKSTTTARKIVPATDNSYDLGSNAENSVLRWANVYAVNFHGDLDGNASTATAADHLTRTLTVYNLAGTATKTFTGASATGIQLSDLISAGETLPLSMIPKSAIERIYTYATQAAALAAINDGTVNMGDLIQITGDKTYYVTQDLTHNIAGNERETPVVSFNSFEDCTAEFIAGTASEADHVSHTLTLTINNQGAVTYNGSSTSTFDVPAAGTGTTGVVTTDNQSFSGTKTFINAVTLSDNLTVSGTTSLGAVTSSSITPGSPNSFSLGDSTNVWANVYATTFTGDLTGTAANASQTVGALSFSESGDGYPATSFNGSSNLTLSTFKPATASSSDGTKGGLVPAPTAGKIALVLRSNGKWASISGTSGINVSSTGSSNGSFVFSHSNAVTAVTSYLGQSSNVTIDVGSYATGSTSNAGTFTIPAFTYDEQGHITGSTSATITFSKLTVTQHLSSGLKVATVGTTDIYAGVEWETFP